MKLLALVKVPLHSTGERAYRTALELDWQGLFEIELQTPDGEVTLTSCSVTGNL